MQVGARVRREASISAATPMLRRCAITLSPCATKARLRPAELRDIGDGAERDEIEQVEQLGLGAVLEKAARAQRADQRGGEQEADADRGEMAVRGALALVEPVGVDQRERVRQRGGAFVVVDDDHVDRRRRAPSRAPRTPARRNRR